MAISRSDCCACNETLRACAVDSDLVGNTCGSSGQVFQAGGSCRPGIYLRADDPVATFDGKSVILWVAPVGSFCLDGSRTSNSAALCAVCSRRRAPDRS